jgi:predicted RNase H-like nuclease (RuvC/YqgF family)
MSTWQSRDEGQGAQDEHEARLEAQGYVEWMRDRQRQESPEHQLQALSEEVRRLRDELAGLQRTVESLLERDADPTGAPQPVGEVVKLDDGFIIPL